MGIVPSAPFSYTSCLYVAEDTPCVSVCILHPLTKYHQHFLVSLRPSLFIVRGAPEDEQGGAGKEAVTVAQGEKEACSVNFR